MSSIELRIGNYSYFSMNHVQIQPVLIEHASEFTTLIIYLVDKRPKLTLDLMKTHAFNIYNLGQYGILLALELVQ